MLLIFRSPQVEIDNPCLIISWIIDEMLLPVVRVSEPNQAKEVSDNECLNDLFDYLDDVDSKSKESMEFALQKWQFSSQPSVVQWKIQFIL